MKLWQSAACLFLQLVRCRSECDDDRGSFPITGPNAFMDCGNATLCGMLALETGFGGGTYQHPVPTVHGLWPETGSYGTSKCIAPRDPSNPSTLFSCYDTTNDTAHQLSFEIHEWEKHGICAGSENATDFFTQVCRLAEKPLAAMASTRARGVTDINIFANDLSAAGFPIWSKDAHNAQIGLSACAGDDGKWKLADVTDMPSVCHGSFPPSPPGPPPPPPPPPASQCVPGKHGPPCSTDADCVGKVGCIRCASSGYCTDVPDFCR
jgi:hypothetical protein